MVLQPGLTTTSDRNQEIVMARANAIFNQIYVVSLNAGSPAGLGRSVIVSRVRELGTAGVSRIWEQAKRRVKPPFALG